MLRKISALFLTAALLLSVGVFSSAEDAAPAENTVVEVSTVDEFLAALAPDTTIILAPGEYDLTRAETYSYPDGPCHRWMYTYDGYELEIHDAANLTLIGSGNDTLLCTEPRYANVLKFVNCENITLKDMTVGHTQQPGTCCGGVLYFDGCSGISVENCGLYGCGILGIIADRCKFLSATGCRIYSCSDGAVQLNSCYDVRLDDCEIYDCGKEFGYSLFSVSGCTGVGIVNSRIYNNNAQTMLLSCSSQQVTVQGCRFLCNTFDSEFDCASSSPVVSGCYWGDRLFNLYSDGSDYALTPDGTQLGISQLQQMEYAPAEYTGPQQAQQPELNRTLNDAGMYEVKVRNVDELLASLASDTVVTLAPGVYDLNKASDYGGYGSDAYYWRADYDGPCLVLSGLKNLTIHGEGAVIRAEPRYADVLAFENCSGITLTGFVAGHTEEPGTCSGGVLHFSGCSDVTVQTCHLYGCGIYGISAWGTKDMTVKETEIYDCTMGAVTLMETENIVFESCDVHDCPQPEFMLSDSHGTLYNGQELLYGSYVLTENGPEEYIYNW